MNEPAAWFEFADNGNIVFWTRDPNAAVLRWGTYANNFALYRSGSRVEASPAIPSGERIELETTDGNIATLEHWTENRLERKPEEAYETLVAKFLRDFALLQSEVKRLTDKDEFRVRELIAAGMPASAAPLLAAKDRWQDRAEMAEKALAKLQASETPEERQAKIVAASLWPQLLQAADHLERFGRQMGGDSNAALDDYIAVEKAAELLKQIAGRALISNQTDAKGGGG